MTLLILLVQCGGQGTYVDAINLQSHMRTMKIYQPMSGLRDPPSWMVFIMVDAQEYKPRTLPGSDGSSPTRRAPTLSLSLFLYPFEISPREVRRRFGGGTSSLHTRKNTCVSRPRRNPPQDHGSKADIIRAGDFHSSSYFE